MDIFLCVCVCVCVRERERERERKRERGGGGGGGDNKINNKRKGNIKNMNKYISETKIKFS